MPEKTASPWPHLLKRMRTITWRKHDFRRGSYTGKYKPSSRKVNSQDLSKRVAVRVGRFDGYKEEKLGQREASSHPEKIGQKPRTSTSLPSVQPSIGSPRIYPSGQELYVVT